VDSGALAQIKRSALQRNDVRGASHLTAKRVYFKHKVTLARAADCRIARHITRGVEIDSEDERLQTHASTCESRFYTGVTCTDNGDVSLPCFVSI
jgi:hypothetical protein